MQNLLRTLLIGSTILCAVAGDRDALPLQSPTVSVLDDVFHESPTLSVLNAAKSACPDTLSMEQLRQLQKGDLKLGDVKFSLPDTKKERAEFANMLPNKHDKLSENKSIAKISEEDNARELVRYHGWYNLICNYTFRTAVKSKLGGTKHKFAIVSYYFSDRNLNH